MKNVFLNCHVKSKSGTEMPKSAPDFELFSSFWFDKIRALNLENQPSIFCKTIWKKFHFFTIFRFELGLGVHMKVVGMGVRFIMALV
jgi:hypothetical protein